MDIDETLDFANLSISEPGPIIVPDWLLVDPGHYLTKVNKQLRATKDIILRCTWLRCTLEAELASWTEDSSVMRQDLERRLKMIEQREVSQFLELGYACYEMWADFRPYGDNEMDNGEKKMLNSWLRAELERQFRDYLQTNRKVRTFAHWVYSED